jgi:hypothetical protein
MKSTVFRLKPPAASAAVEQVEPLAEAVREVSERIAQNNVERRLLFSRLDELRGLTPLRRRRTRPAPPSMSSPVTFYSIDEAGASSASATLQVARGGR